MKRVLKIFIIFILIILISCNFSFNSIVFAEGGEEVQEEITDEKSLDDIFGEADAFLKKDNGNTLDDTAIKETSKLIYNILLAVGTIAAVIVGLILGIKFMISTVDKKAEIKKALVGYFIGCIILFGAFGIWSTTIRISNEVASIQDEIGEEYLSKEELEGNEDGDGYDGNGYGGSGSGGSGYNGNGSNDNGQGNKISVNKITLSQTLVAIDTSISKSSTLKTSIEPNNATDKKLTWEVTEGGQVVKVNQSGKITAKNPGTAIVRVSLNSNKNVYAECKVVVLHSLHENVQLKSNTKGTLYGSNKKITLKKNTIVELLGTMRYGKDTVKVRYNGQIISIKKSALNFVNYHIDSAYDNSVYESWLNKYNPSSATKYLIWVNQGTLRLMIFKKTNKKWKMIENEPCSTGDVENKGCTGIHTDLIVKDFGIDVNPGLGDAIHVKWKKTGLYFGNTIHRTISAEEENGLGRYPASHGCPTISATFRDKLKANYGNKLINSTVIYF